MRESEETGMSGEHKGLGPKTAKTGEDPVLHAVHDALTHEAWLDATDIELLVTGGKVTLTGTVNTEQQRELAGKTSAAAKGVTEVVNNLTIDANSGVAEMNRIRNITDRGR